MISTQISRMSLVILVGCGQAGGPEFGDTPDASTKGESSWHAATLEASTSHREKLSGVRVPDWMWEFYNHYPDLGPGYWPSNNSWIECRLLATISGAVEACEERSGTEVWEDGESVGRYLCSWDYFECACDCIQLHF